MASDSDWVDDVRRWFNAGKRSLDAGAPPPAVDDPEAGALGYEAAHPSLQARNWPDAPPADTGSGTRKF